MLINDNYLEPTTYISYKYIIGKSLDVYNYFFPQSNLFINPKLLEQEFGIAFKSAEAKILEIPRDWNKGYVDMVLSS